MRRWDRTRARRRLGLRLARWRRARFQVAQCAVAAALAWLVATELLGHTRPFFAPVAAVVALGVAYGQRTRRAVEVVVGVAIGVAVGDLLVTLLGTGWWQIALVVGIAMSLAVLLDAGTVLITQSGVQAVIVTTLLPQADAGLSRWLDAVVGGAVAVAVATVAPRQPLRRPREIAGGVLRDLADLLGCCADAARGGDQAAAELALDRARGTDASIAALRQAATEGLDVVRVSPFRRRHGEGLRSLSATVQPLDRAARNVRVLARRVVAATRVGETVSAPVTTLVAELADAVSLLAGEVVAGEDLAPAARRLRDVAELSARVPRGDLSADVVLAQVRSAVVDLLQVTGLSQADALARVPPPQRRDVGG